VNIVQSDDAPVHVLKVVILSQGTQGQLLEENNDLNILVFDQIHE
jgi:hypothetical protein